MRSIYAIRQPEVSMDVDLNTVRQIVASGAAPKIYPLGTQLVNTYTDKDGKTYSCPWDVVQPDDTAEGETGSTAPAGRRRHEMKPGHMAGLHFERGDR